MTHRPVTLLIGSLLIGCLSLGCQTSMDTSTAAVATTQVVEAACGQCQFGLPGTGCDLAVRIDGNAAYVDGSGIDDHGDAHGDDGLCNAIRRARVSGVMIGGRFVAETFELVPAEATSDRPIHRH